MKSLNPARLIHREVPIGKLNEGQYEVLITDIPREVTIGGELIITKVDISLHELVNGSVHGFPLSHSFEKQHELRHRVFVPRSRPSLREIEEQVPRFSWLLVQPERIRRWDEVNPLPVGEVASGEVTGSTVVGPIVPIFLCRSRLSNNNDNKGKGKGADQHLHPTQVLPQH